MNYNALWQKKRNNRQWRSICSRSWIRRCAEGRHDDDEARRLADDEAGGDCHEHPEPGDEGRREGCAVHPEHSDEGEDHEEKINPNNMMDLSYPDKRDCAVRQRAKLNKRI